jgi:hypothetical protein
MAESFDDPMDMLNAAVNAKAAVSVLNTDGSGQSISGQFVAHAKPTDPGMIWARPAVKHAPTSHCWASIKARVSVRYSVGQINAGAEAVIVKQIRDYWLTDTLPISAFLLQQPSKVWVDQREHQRYQLRNDGGGIRATLARTALEHPPRSIGPEVKADVKGQPQAQTQSNAKGVIARTDRVRTPRLIGPEARASLWDIGMGGAGFICPFNRAFVQTAPNQPFDVTIEFAGRKATLPGICAYARANGNLLRIGIKFDHAVASPGAMLLLKQVIAELEKRTAQWERRSA